jgi:hypothetical protein
VKWALTLIVSEKSGFRVNSKLCRAPFFGRDNQNDCLGLIILMKQGVTFFLHFLPLHKAQKNLKCACYLKKKNGQRPKGAPNLFMT